MEKLNGKKKIIVSVFISGRGTNLKSLIEFSKKKNSPIQIALIICLETHLLSQVRKRTTTI